MDPDRLAMFAKRVHFSGLTGDNWGALQKMAQALTDLQAENIASMQTIAELRAENERLRDALEAIWPFVESEAENREASGDLMTDYVNEAREAHDRIKSALA